MVLCRKSCYRKIFFLKIAKFCCYLRQKLEFLVGCPGFNNNVAILGTARVNTMCFLVCVCSMSAIKIFGFWAWEISTLNSTIDKTFIYFHSSFANGNSWPTNFGIFVKIIMANFEFTLYSNKINHQYSKLYQTKNN